MKEKKNTMMRKIMMKKEVKKMMKKDREMEKQNEEGKKMRTTRMRRMMHPLQKGRSDFRNVKITRYKCES